jgi:cobalamin-dependent methionine synthase I
MKVKILTLDTSNKNERVYPYSVFKKALDEARTNLINERRFLIVDKQQESTTVNLKDVIGVANDIQIEGDDVIADIAFFPTAHGIREAITEGKLFVATSGMGTLTKQPDGNYRVGDDYELICCFLTDDPA